MTSRGRWGFAVSTRISTDNVGSRISESFELQCRVGYYCSTASHSCSRSVVGQSRVDKVRPSDGDELSVATNRPKKGRCWHPSSCVLSEDVWSNPSSDTFASTHRRRHPLQVHFLDGSCKTSRRNLSLPFHQQVSPLPEESGEYPPNIHHVLGVNTACTPRHRRPLRLPHQLPRPSPPAH